LNRRSAFNNFDLHIGEGERGHYPLSVLYSPAGETMQPVRVPIDQDDPPIRGWLQSLQNGFIKGDELEALGRRLADYLLPLGPVRDLYQRSLGLTEAKELRLRLRLRLSTPDLARIPWEYVYDESIGDFLALNTRTALVRYHGQPVPPQRIVSRLPVPILVIISNPSTTQHLAVSKEMRNLIEALEWLLSLGWVTIGVLFTGTREERSKIAGLMAERAGCRLLPDPASVDALRDALRQEYRILHYIGHGVFDERRGGALLLADDAGVESLINAQTLARELRSSSIALIVLNACQSAVESTARSFMGSASSLIRAGVPAVVAMQFAIADSSAIAFSSTLYKALADGWPLDSAMTEGRKAISAQPGQDNGDWGIPVLFMRSPDGVLWEQKPADAPEEPTALGSASEDVQPGTRSGGVTFHGPARVEGDVAGRDLYKVIGQTQSALTPAEHAEMERLLARLRDELAGLDIPEGKRIVGLEFVEQLEHELTKTDVPPDASTIKVAGTWLLKNVPALTGTLASLFAHPTVAKAVKAAGEIAADWAKGRFGGEAGDWG
jgi:hypothetical protein